MSCDKEGPYHQIEPHSFSPKPNTSLWRQFRFVLFWKIQIHILLEAHMQSVDGVWDNGECHELPWNSVMQNTSTKYPISSCWILGNVTIIIFAFLTTPKDIRLANPCMSGHNQAIPAPPVLAPTKAFGKPSSSWEADFMWDCPRQWRQRISKNSSGAPQHKHSKTILRMTRKSKSAKAKHVSARKARGLQRHLKTHGIQNL